MSAEIGLVVIVSKGDRFRSLCGHFQVVFIGKWVCMIRVREMDLETTKRIGEKRKVRGQDGFL